MKDLIIIVIIIGIIIGGDFFVKEHLSDTTSKLINHLNELKEKVIIAKEDNNREEIKKDMQKVEEHWKEISDIWSTVIVHQELDNIQQALVRAKIDISEGNIEDSIPEIETAIFYAEHIKEREQLKIKNIF